MLVLSGYCGGGFVKSCSEEGKKQMFSLRNFFAVFKSVGFHLAAAFSLLMMLFGLRREGRWTETLLQLFTGLTIHPTGSLSSWPGSAGGIEWLGLEKSVGTLPEHSFLGEKNFMEIHKLGLWTPLRVKRKVALDLPVGTFSTE